MNSFIPVYEYAKRRNTSKQNVYRWIREGKFDAESVTEVEITKKKLLIRETASPRGK